MQLVILAAGKGTRLEAVHKDLPKSLVPVQGKPYLTYQLECFDQFLFNNKIIVLGHKAHALKEYFNKQNKSGYEFVLNENYEWGNLYSLLSAKEKISDDFYLFNADHYYSQENYKKIFSYQSNDFVVFCDDDRALTNDDMKVGKNTKEQLVMQKTLHEYDCGYVGITRVPKDKLDIYWNACEVVKDTVGQKANVEAVVNELAKQGQKIDICDISGSWWTEIDTPEDLFKAESIINERTMDDRWR